jgi:hypothetical protein
MIDTGLVLLAILVSMAIAIGAVVLIIRLLFTFIVWLETKKWEWK